MTDKKTPDTTQPEPEVIAVEALTEMAEALRTLKHELHTARLQLPLARKSTNGRIPDA